MGDLHLTAKDFVFVDLNETEYPLNRFETERIENHENVFRIFGALQPKPRDHYEHWVPSLPESPATVDTVYFPSCGSMGFTNRLFAMMDIFEMTGIEYRALGPFDLDLCCGYMHLTCGEIDIAEKRSRDLVAALQAFGPREVVVGCPWSYRWLRDYVSQIAPYTFSVKHQLQFIAENLDKLEFKELPVSVAYHDSCSIGRWTHEYDAARRILKYMPGVNYVELPRNQAQSGCCGNGAPNELYLELVDERLSEAKDAGAEVVTAVCGGCVLGFSKHSERHGLTATNIINLIAQGLGIEHEDILSRCIDSGDVDSILSEVGPNIQQSEYTIDEMRNFIPKYLFGVRTFGLLDETLEKKT